MVALAAGAPNEMEFRVLGSLEVVDHDGPVALGAPKQRALLAVLLLHRGEPVSTDRLIDEIWGEQPPASANKIVQGYVSNLRKVLGDGRLVTQGRGYMLQIEPGRTDVDRFEALVARGPAGARERRRVDRGCCPARGTRGMAGSRADAISPTSRSPNRRSRGWRNLAWSCSRIGSTPTWRRASTRGWWASSRRWCASIPLRERLQGQLMLALYRSGRQADALETYHIARDRLIDELGLEPGPDAQGARASDPRPGPGARGPGRPSPRGRPRRAGADARRRR